MITTLKTFLASELFIPHGHCYLWKTELVWFHIISDANIALAYYSIPLTLVYFVRKQKDFPFIWIVWLFGAFIVACGTTHVMEIWTLWHPTYWLSGLLKAITAFVSIYTALALIPLIPKALALPSATQLEHEIIERKLVEEALRESEERFRNAFDYAAIGKALVALDGRWIQVNRSLCEIVGYCEQELLSTSFQAITHPDDLECDLNYVNQLFSGEIRYYQMEKRYLHKKGHIVWILLSGSLVRDRNGEPLYFIAQIQDITQRIQVEAALRQSEERYRAIVEDQTELIARFQPDGTLTFINESYCRYFGQSRSQLIGNCYQPVVFPEDLEKIAQLLNSLNSETPVRTITHRVVVAGEVRWMQWINRAIFDKQGDFVEFQSVGRDITAQKQMEEALKESEQRWQLALRGNNDGIWDWNPITNEVFFSTRWKEMLGYEDHEIGNHLDEWSSRVHPNDLNWVMETVTAHLEQKTPYYRSEHRMRCKDGSYKWILDRGQALFNDARNPVRVVGSHTDITERKLAEKALRQSVAREREKAIELALAMNELKRTQIQLIQAEKMSSLGQMVAGIAHEINNPVGFIYANIKPASDYVQDLLHLVELYQQHYPDPVKQITEQLEISEPEFIKEDFPKLLESMKDGAERISQIVMSLKNFSRLDETKRKQVNIHEGIDNTLLIMQHRLKQYSPHSEIIVIKEYGQLPKVDCFPNELNQAFMNILSNAIDALNEFSVNAQLPEATKQSNNNEELTTDFRPTIRICTHVAKDSRVVIRIANNGVSIKPEVQPKIFDPFFTTKPPGKGKGLGLFICYQIIVEKHGGKLTCHSLDGQGTEFVIELPLELPIAQTLVVTIK